MVLTLDEKWLVLSLLSGCDANRSDCKSVRVIPPWELNTCPLRQSAHLQLYKIYRWSSIEEGR